MSVLNLETAKWLIAATLALPGVLAIASYQYQRSQAERQINDARLRLYTELLSKREEADAVVRRGIFDKVLERYLTPGDQGLQAKLVALELLASNFHDSLDLSPLFWQIDRDVKRAPKGKRTAQKQMGQVFTLNNLTFLSYVFLPWLAHCGSNTTERCTT